MQYRSVRTKLNLGCSILALGAIALGKQTSIPYNRHSARQEVALMCDSCLGMSMKCRDEGK